jgi:PST family polysaccharide transporter
VLIVTQIVMARLLTPAEYGTVTLAAAILALLSTIGMWGLDKALLQSEAPEFGSPDLFATTAFWLRVGYGVLLMLLTVIAAQMLSVWYEAEVLAILPLLAFGQAMATLGEVHQSLMVRQMMLTQVGIIELIGGAVAAGVGITMAILGYGAWALATYFAVRAALPKLMSIPVSPFRPVLEFSKKQANILWDFCRNSFGAEIMAWVLYRQGDDFVVGSIAGVTELGYYSISYRLTKLWHMFIIDPVMRVVIPPFSRVREDTQKLADTYSFVARNVARLVIPMNVLLAILAPQVIGLLFGEQWLPAVLVFRIQTVYAVLAQLYVVDFYLYYALAMPRKVLLTQAVSLVVFAVSMIPLTFLYQSAGAAVALNLVSLAAFVVVSRWTSRLIGVAMYQLVPTPLVGTAVAALVGLVVLFNLPPGSHLVEIAIVSFSFLLPYAICLILLDRHCVVQDLRLIRKSLSSSALRRSA